MARRGWVWTLGAGLWSCLATGCPSLFVHSDALIPEVPAPPVHAGKIPTVAASPVSDYAPSLNVMAHTADPPASRDRAAATAGLTKAAPTSSKAVGLAAPAELAPDLARAAGAEAIAAAKLPDDPNLVAALRYFLDKHPDEALERLQVYDKGNQELLLGLFPLLARLTEGSLARAKAEEVENLVNSFDNLLEPLRARLPLTIGKLCFCRIIRSFGDYDPLPEHHGFHHDEQVQIYIELRNFHTRECRLPGGEVRYVMQLASSYKIVEDKQPARTVLEGTFLRDRTEGAESSRTLRHDYFENYTFPVPDLPPGSYNLVIQVEDRGTTPPRTVQHTLYFRVTSPYLPGQDT
jgi:hypothetical protein